MQQDIMHTLAYFAHFEYPPTREELRTFLLVKASKKSINKVIDHLITKKLILEQNGRIALDAPIFEHYEQKQQRAEALLDRAIPLLKCFRLVPTISCIGISGSLSMKNIRPGDDIDVCIITQKGTLWLSRSLILIITRMLHFLGNTTFSSFCFNLFMEKESLLLPQHKRNEYTAHELMQLKPIINKKQTYELLLHYNSWVQNILPNVQIRDTIEVKEFGSSLLHKALWICDIILSIPQKWWLDRKGYTYQEYGRQVWFIQNDYEKKIDIEIKRIT